MIAAGAGPEPTGRTGGAIVAAATPRRPAGAGQLRPRRRPGLAPAASATGNGAPFAGARCTDFSLAACILAAAAAATAPSSLLGSPQRHRAPPGGLGRSLAGWLRAARVAAGADNTLETTAMRLGDSSARPWSRASLAVGAVRMRAGSALSVAPPPYPLYPEQRRSLAGRGAREL